MTSGSSLTWVAHEGDELVLHDLAISTNVNVFATYQRCTPVRVVKHRIRVIVCNIVSDNLEPALDLFARQLAISIRVQHFECFTICRRCERRCFVACADGGTPVSTGVSAQWSTTPEFRRKSWDLIKPARSLTS